MNNKVLATIEQSVRIDSFGGGIPTGEPHIIMQTFILKGERTVEEMTSILLNSLSEMGEAVRGRREQEAVDKMLGFIFEDKINLMKYSRYTIDDEVYTIINYVYPEVMGDSLGAIFWNSRKFAADKMEYVDTNRLPEGGILITTPLRGIIYSLPSVFANRISSEKISILARIAIDPTSFFAVTVSCPPGKIYNNGNAIKLTYRIFDNLIDAMDSQDVTTIGLVSATYGIGLLTAVISHQNDGNYIIKKIYRGKIRYAKRGDNSIFYDSELALRLGVSFARRRPDTHIIAVSQYTDLVDIFRTDRFGGPHSGAAHKTIIKLIPRDTITPGGVMTDRGYGPGSGVIITKLKNGSTKSHSFTVGGVEGPFVIPYSKENDVSGDVIELLASARTVRSDNLRDLCRDYAKLVSPVYEDDEDNAIETWFNCCKMASTRNTGSLLATYQKMHEDLLAEQKFIALYLGQTNISKCLPIPQVEVKNLPDSRMGQTLHTQVKNDKIILSKRENEKYVWERNIMITMQECRESYLSLRQFPINTFYSPDKLKVVIDCNRREG